MTKLLMLILMASALDAANVLRIACGSSTSGTDAAGVTWQSDAFFSGGTDYSRADMAALGYPYRALRNGPTFAYNIPLPNGDYTVKLYWVEIRTAASSPPISTGQRKFAVSVGGTVINPSLDLFAAAGSFMPYTMTFPVTVSNGMLSISETAATGSLGALLSGIAIDSVDAPPPLPFARYVTGTTAAVPQCPESGLTFAYVSDTDKLYWCWSGGNWFIMSDLVNPPSIFHLQALDECQGSGGTVPNAWDCSGMFRAMIGRNDGKPPLSLVGIDLTVSGGAYPPVTWVPAK